MTPRDHAVVVGTLRHRRSRIGIDCKHGQLHSLQHARVIRGGADAEELLVIGGLLRLWERQPVDSRCGRAAEDGAPRHARGIVSEVLQRVVGCTCRCAHSVAGHTQVLPTHPVRGKAVRPSGRQREWRASERMRQWVDVHKGKLRRARGIGVEISTGPLGGAARLMTIHTRSARHAALGL